MKISDCVGCGGFPCADVKHDCYIVPGIDLNPRSVSMAMISEAAPHDPGDYFYAGGNPAFEQATVKAFRDAGCDVSCVKELVARGVYLTTAVKCAKTGYGIKSDTVRECSRIMARELSLFPNLKVLMLMGDVAIKALNYLASHLGEKRVVPAIPTYKIRGQSFLFKGIRVLPSYLQVGPSLSIEKGKQKVIAQDIAAGLRLAGI